MWYRHPAAPFGATTSPHHTHTHTHTHTHIFIIRASRALFLLCVCGSGRLNFVWFISSFEAHTHTAELDFLNVLAFVFRKNAFRHFTCTEGHSDFAYSKRSWRTQKLQ